MKRATVLVGFAALTSTATASAQELSYRLPHATLAAGWQARLESCPEAGSPLPIVNAQPAIAGAYAGGELVRLNPASPFLGSRSIALTYHENDTLKTISAEGEGKAGSVLASLLKAGAGYLALGPVGAAASMAVGQAQRAGGPLPPGAAPLACLPHVKKQVDRWHELRADISAFETRLTTGQPLPSLQQSVYEQRKTELAEVEKSLLLSSSFKWEPDRSKVAAANGEPYELFGFVQPIDYSKWFNSTTGFRPDKGEHGFCVRFRVTQDALSSSQPLPTFGVRTWRRDFLAAGERLRTNIPHERFIYLRPVPVEVEVRERTSPLPSTSTSGSTGDSADTCKNEFASLKDEKLASKTISVPQLSGYFILPLGAGMFESKSTAAEFSVDGRIVSLSHKAGGSGAGVAEALAGALTAAETMRDADTKALQRRLDREKAEAELEKLLNPSPTSTVTE